MYDTLALIIRTFITMLLLLILTVLIIPTVLRDPGFYVMISSWTC